MQEELNQCLMGPLCIYTDEVAYLSDLANLGYSTFLESFEVDATWGSVREPNSAVSITLQSSWNVGKQKRD